MNTPHISKETWHEKKSKEKENTNHPCDYWWGNLCMCKGSCSCHWLNEGGSVTTNAIEVSPVDAAELTVEAERTNKAMSLLQKFEIKSQADMEFAGELVKTVKDQWNAYEERRTAMTKPINAGLRSINDLFRPLLEPLKAAENALKTKIASYTLKMRAEQEKAMRAAAEAVQVGNTVAATELVAAIAPQAPVQGVTVKEVWDWRITNEALVPREYLSVDPNKIKNVFTNPMHGLVPNIPGIEFFKKGSVTVRT